MLDFPLVRQLCDADAWGSPAATASRVRRTFCYSICARPEGGALGETGGREALSQGTLPFTLTQSGSTLIQEYKSSLPSSLFHLAFIFFFFFLRSLAKQIWKKKKGKNRKKLFIFQLVGMEISIFKDMALKGQRFCRAAYRAVLVCNPSNMLKNKLINYDRQIVCQEVSAYTWKKTKLFSRTEACLCLRTWLL